MIRLIYPSIDKLLNQVGSKYLLVNIVSKRAQEIRKENNLQLDEKDYLYKSSLGRSLEEVSKQKIKLEEE